MIKFFNKKMSKKRKGFTLIELVVVIAILGILAALAIPRLGSTRVTAEKGTIEANLRTIDSAIMIYQADKGIYPENVAALVEDPSYLAADPTEVDKVTYAIDSTDGRAQVTIAAGKFGEGKPLEALGPINLDELRTSTIWANIK